MRRPCYLLTVPARWACCLLFAASAGPAAATNTGFLPGDAFFHTTLTKDVADELAAGGSVVLRYRRPDHVDGACAATRGTGTPNCPPGTR